MSKTDKERLQDNNTSILRIKEKANNLPDAKINVADGRVDGHTLILKSYKPYTELSYIYNNGNAYINTNIIPSSNTKLEFGVVEPTQLEYWCGSLTYTESHKPSSGNWWNREVFAVCNDGTGGMYVAYNNSNEGVGSSTVISTTSKLVFYKGALLVNDVMKFQVEPYDEEFSLSYPLYIFGQNRRGANFNGNKSCKIEYFKIYNNDTLLLDLIPVMRKSDYVICMYDTVTETYITNAGTGSFIAGPIKN